MSNKHFFHEYQGLVVRTLKGLVACNPSLALNQSEKVIYNPSHSLHKISLISGGGSGHEPAWSGYVGNGMLAAAVNGEIFGSPSAKQVLAGITSVPSTKGTILCITNYTGDKLHFGLACEKAKARGVQNIAVLSFTDDVALGRKRAGVVGRRGLAGNVLGLKILGAAADLDMGFEDCLNLGRAINSNLVTIGASLNFCHVLGRINHEKVPDDVCVLGMGIHNEPGLEKISPLPTPEELVRRMLAYLVDPNDEDRAFVEFVKGDHVVLLVNNFGGTSSLELMALANEATQQLASTWSIKPTRSYCGTFETSLNGPGFSISLLNVTGASRESGIPASEILDYLDSPTTAPAWPVRKEISDQTNDHVNGNAYLNGFANNNPTTATIEQGLKIDPIILDNVIRTACQKAIDAEPLLTKWDMVMGDGDCGESVQAVCKSIIERLDHGLASSGSITAVLDGIISSVDDMGGTLGAIFGIFLAAFSSSFQQQQQQSGTVTKASQLKQSLSISTLTAIKSLMSHTGARVGDRTVMDVLIPFCENFGQKGSFSEAVNVAEKAGESTRGMKPRFGRATYVTSNSEEEQYPDPGAWAVVEMVQGLQQALSHR